MDAVLEVLSNSTSEDSTAMIKEKLGATFSYSDIRIVKNFLQRTGTPQ